MAKPLSMDGKVAAIIGGWSLAVPGERCLVLRRLQLDDIVASAVSVGPPMMLVWHRLGSPKDPRGSVGLFCFGDRESVRTRGPPAGVVPRLELERASRCCALMMSLGSRFDLDGVRNAAIERPHAKPPEQEGASLASYQNAAIAATNARSLLTCTSIARRVAA
jgi:hypothetical protein